MNARRSPQRARWTWLDAALIAAFAVFFGFLLWRAGAVFSYKWNW